MIYHTSYITYLSYIMYHIPYAMRHIVHIIYHTCSGPEAGHQALISMIIVLNSIQFSGAAFFVPTSLSPMYIIALQINQICNPN